jgi:hypothetical protein
MTNNLLSIAPSEKSTRRESPTAFLVEELFSLEESMNEFVRWILWAVVIEVLISIAALVAWFRF